MIYYSDGSIFFLSNLYLKKKFGLVYVMVDFICMGLLELQGARSEKSLPTARLELTTLGLRSHYRNY